MNTEDFAEGSGKGEAVDETPSAPPAYPVLSQPGQQIQQQQQQQPQQIIYGQPPQQQQQPQQVIYGQPPQQQQQPQQVIYGQPPQQQQGQQNVVYANSQQPQQVIYGQQQDDSKQLELELNDKFIFSIKLLNDKKDLISKSLNNTNSEQKKDLIAQLTNLINTVNTIKINKNIKPRPQPQAQPQAQPQIIYAQQPPPQQQQVIIQQMQPNIKVVNDTWQILNNEIVLNQQLNSVHRNGKGQWLSTFGQQTINKGQYKKWEIKIIPKIIVRNAKQGIADIVIGIADSKLVKQIGSKKGSFWLRPFYGYGFYGFNGKKFHINKKNIILLLE
eukprot:240362_1